MFLSKTHLLAWLTLTGNGLFSVLGLMIGRFWSAPFDSGAGSSVRASFLINASLL